MYCSYRFKLLHLLPGKRDKKWLFGIPLLTVAIWAVLTGITTLILGLSMGALDIILCASMAAIASIMICGFFYAGLYIAATAAVLGAVSGIAFMAYVFMQPIDHRGIVGLSSAAQMAFIFFLVGISAQMIFHLRKKIGGNKHE
jgi:hypothetical protein